MSELKRKQKSKVIELDSTNMLFPDMCVEICLNEFIQKCALWECEDKI